MDNGIGVFVVVGVLLLLAILLWKLFASPATPAPPVPVDEPEAPSGDVRAHVLQDVLFIRQRLREIPMAEDRRASLEAQLARLETRARRRELYLAVIGEFNSGKSTFINALMRQRVLKSANVATTASATEIRYGSQLRLTVRLSDGSTVMGTEGDCAAVAARFNRYFDPARDRVSLLQWIELVTAHPDASRIVDTIQIEAPADWLDRGICILDTPGVGAGPEYAAHHQAVTERVLTEDADTAVVLIPADSSISRTLLDFLDAVVRPFLSRSIFVITKLDGVDPAERPAIHQHVSTVLTKFLGAAPVVFEAGALTVLLPPDPASEKEPDCSYWRGEFSTLQATLFETMSRQGPAIVAETLIRLLHLAMDDLQAEIVRRREEVRQHQQTLEANSIQKIEHVLGSARKRCQGALDQTVAQVSRELSSARQRFETHAKQQVGDLVDAVGWGNLKETINDRIPAAIADEERSFNEKVNESFTLLDQRCDESHQVFAEEFENWYRNLKSLGIPQLQRSLAAIPRTRPSLTGVMTGTPFRNGPRWRDFIGIAFNKEKKRGELRAVLFPAIAGHAAGAAAQWQARLSAAAAAIRAELDRAVAIHMQEYAQVVQAMIREHEKRRAQLEAEQARIEAHTRELKGRAERLEQLRQGLAKSASAAG